MLTNSESGTNVHEIAERIYRINTPLGVVPGGFSFNQYLIAGDEPLLFHTGLRKTFPMVLEAVRSVMPAEQLRYVAFSHFEQDECGSLNDWLAVAPHAVALCSKVANWPVPIAPSGIRASISPSSNRAAPAQE